MDSVLGYKYIKNVQVQVQVQGFVDVFGYYLSTLQMYLGTITKYQVQMYNITHYKYTGKCTNTSHTDRVE